MALNRYKPLEIGKTSYGHNVLASIVGLAAQEIAGVCSLQGKGVRTQVSDTKVVVDIFINVLGTVKCNEIAYRVQDNIRRSVESMTEYKVDAINVNILRVTFMDNESAQ
jgi:uncharacterized alkaline shock family protein YloU